MEQIPQDNGVKDRGAQAVELVASQEDHQEHLGFGGTKDGGIGELDTGLDDGLDFACCCCCFRLI